MTNDNDRVQALLLLPATVSEWHMDGEPAPNGTPGGDGSGEATGVVYLNEHYPLRRITVDTYVVDRVERGYPTLDDRFRWEVETMTCFEILDEEGEVVDTADIHYENPYDVAFDTEERAAQARDADVARWQLWDTKTLPIFNWNGERS